MMRCIDPVADQTLRRNAGERLAGDQRAYLSRVPMPDRSVKNGHEWPQPCLDPGITEIEQI
jgi:hypothetical protein